MLAPRLAPRPTPAPASVASTFKENVARPVSARNAAGQEIVRRPPSLYVPLASRRSVDSPPEDGRVGGACQHAFARCPGRGVGHPLLPQAAASLSLCLSHRRGLAAVSPDRSSLDSQKLAPLALPKLILLTTKKPAPPAATGAAKEAAGTGATGAHQRGVVLRPPGELAPIRAGGLRPPSGARRPTRPADVPASHAARVQSRRSGAATWQRAQEESQSLTRPTSHGVAAARAPAGLSRRRHSQPQSAAMAALAAAVPAGRFRRASLLL